MSSSKMTIYHISDIHLGESGVHTQDFRRILDGIEQESQKVDSPLLLVTGDLTSDGLREEYEDFAREFSKIDISNIIIPGNHDERNYGSSVFEELFGSRFKTFDNDLIAMFAVDSAEPDNDAGHVGRENYSRIRRFFKKKENKIKIFVLHHHLVAIPHTGREHNVVEDAGDLLSILSEVGCSLVLHGHRHVPWYWNLNGMSLYCTGTLLSRRIRGAHSQAYTRIELDEGSASFQLHEMDGIVSDFAQVQLHP